MVDPTKVISAAIKHVPAVKYALGLAGIAAAASIIGQFVGVGMAGVITIVVMLLGMVFLYLVSAAVTSGPEGKSIPPQATVALWAVTLFICASLFFLTTALWFGWPRDVAALIQLRTSIIDSVFVHHPPRPKAGPAQTSHISGNDCTSDGPIRQLTVTATPGWKLEPGTGHIVQDNNPGYGEIGTQSGVSEDSSHRVFTQSFYGRRPSRNCSAGNVSAHLEAMETWDGG